MTDGVRPAALLFMVFALLGCGPCGDAKAAPSAPAPAAASAQPALAVPPAAPEKTRSAATHIAGLHGGDLRARLEAKDFTCGAPKRASAGATPLEVVECASVDRLFLYTVTFACETSGGVRLITAGLRAVQAVPSSAGVRAASAFLGFIAAQPYDGAEPERARQWLTANVANPAATLTIADAVFEVSAVEPGESYRLTVVANGTTHKAGGVGQLQPVGGASPPGADAGVELTPAMIMKVVRTNTGAVARCFVKHKADLPTEAGQLDVTFTVTRSGQVGVVRSALPETRVGQCVEKVVAGLRFPAHRDNEVSLTLPFAYDVR